MNPNFGLTQDDLSTILTKAALFPDIETVILFGSRATGRQQPGSDIDLCIQGKNLSSETKSKLHYELEEETLLPYFIDVVNYQIIDNPQLKQHIDQFGKIIYQKRSVK